MHKYFWPKHYCVLLNYCPVVRAMREGEKARKVGATNMNEKSSRSHTIFRIKIESTNRVEEEEMSVLEEEEGDGKTIYSILSLHSFMALVQVSK